MRCIATCARAAAIALLLVVAAGGPAAAQRGSLTATLTALRRPATSDTVALRIAVQLTPGWHIGAARPGVSGVPTELTWTIPTGWRLLATRWPAPAFAIIGRDTVFEYRAPFAIDATLVTEGSRRSGPIQAVISYGICRDVCIPGRLTLTHEVR